MTSECTGAETEAFLGAGSCGGILKYLGLSAGVLGVLGVLPRSDLKVSPVGVS